ncbi:MAG: hypothetical protein IJW38_04295, partial [Clostridia bacterium]|nr:hypothetical protein [Clostridia bacterium]
MKKITVGILLIATLTLIFAGTVANASSFGSGALAVAEDVKIIKTGLLGRKITFSDADFKQGLCINDFNKVTITKLPPTSDGTLMLAGRRIGEGTSIKRKNLPSLVFIPSSKDITETVFKVTVDQYASGAEIDFVIKFTDKVNYEPEITDEISASLAIKTQREIGIHGKVEAHDSEGDQIEYVVISYPKCGTLTSFDKNSGEYVYTPRSS